MPDVEIFSEMFESEPITSIPQFIRLLICEEVRGFEVELRGARRVQHLHRDRRPRLLLELVLPAADPAHVARGPGDARRFVRGFHSIRKFENTIMLLVIFK